jgi:hypothetical protein
MVIELIQTVEVHGYNQEHGTVFFAWIESLLLIADRLTKVVNLKRFYDMNHTGWLTITLFFMMLPGMLAILYSIGQWLMPGTKPNANKGKVCTEILFGIFFPFAIIFKHLSSTWKGRNHIRKSCIKLRLFMSLHGFVESAPQTVLHGYIVIQTWTTFGKRS